MKNRLQNSAIEGANNIEIFNNQLPGTFGESKEAGFPTTSEMYDEVFGNSFHPMYIGNSEDQIIKFNKKICKLFGYSESEMMELESSGIFDNRMNSFGNFLNERNAKGKAEANITGIKKSGEKFPCSISSVAYQSDDGEKKSMNMVLDASTVMV